MKKKSLTVILSILTVLSFEACDKAEKRDLMFFYFESCPSCEEYQTAEEFAGKVEKLNASRQWEALSRNLISPEAGRELMTVIKEKGFPDISRSLPLLIIEDEYINGYDAIGSKLEELLSAED